MNCPQLLDPTARHLVDSAWALVAHEKLSSVDAKLGLFHPDNPLAHKSLEARLARYAALGRSMDASDPYAIINKF